MTKTETVGTAQVEEIANIIAHGIDLASTPTAIAERILAARTQSPSEWEVEEDRIDALRLTAFRTNDPNDLLAYWGAASQWFQDRHSRRLRAASIPAPEWQEFTERHRTHFPHPDGTEVEVHGYDTGYCQAFQTVMRVGSPQWKGHARFIAGWRLPAPERSKEETGVRVKPLVDYLWQEMCELPDRSSPEDYPDHALVTKPADGWEWPGLPDIDRIRELAREVGYAIGVHGSLERDLDLIAAPWAADAVGPMELAEHIAAGMGGQVLDWKNQDKPCGRWSCNINTEGWTKMIDLSVMPPAPVPVTITDEEVRNGARGIWDAGETGLPFEMAPPSLVRGLMNQSRACLTAALSQKPGEQG